LELLKQLRDILVADYTASARIGESLVDIRELCLGRNYDNNPFLLGGCVAQLKFDACRDIGTEEGY
jgi:hypothetical protein